MERDDIIRLAREAGAMFDHMTWVERDLAPVFERFAALVAIEKDKQIAKVMRTYEERAQAYLEIAKKMRDESRPDVLESERAANAKLTDELEKAELLAAEKDKQIAELQNDFDRVNSQSKTNLLYAARAIEERETARREEREACALLCDEYGNRDGHGGIGFMCAEAIRARGEK